MSSGHSGWGTGFSTRGSLILCDDCLGVMDKAVDELEVKNKEKKHETKVEANMVGYSR